MEIINKFATEMWKRQTRFKIQELIPLETFEERSEKAIEIFAPGIIVTLITIRDLANRPVLVNDWHFGGKLTQRGFRYPEFYEKKSHSQHLFGNAFDINIGDWSGKKMFDQLITWKQRGHLPYLTGLERNIDWAHVDCRISTRTNKDGLFIFDPGN